MSETTLATPQTADAALAADERLATKEGRSQFWRATFSCWLGTAMEYVDFALYGLAAGIWSRDFPRAMALAERLETGTVWVNTYKTFSISTPFGGFKESGLGREKGLNGIKAYMQQKSVYLALSHQVNRWSD